MHISGMFVQNLEMQESEFQSNCNVKRSELQADVIELEGRIASDWDGKIPSDSLNHSLVEYLEELHAAKKVNCSLEYFYLFIFLRGGRVKAQHWAHPAGTSS